MEYRQATKEQTEDSAWYGEGQGCEQEEGEIDDSLSSGVWDGGTLVLREWALYSCIRLIGSICMEIRRHLGHEGMNPKGS